MEDSLGAWLANELDKRKWSHNELGRQADISQPVISRVIAGDRKAGADFCVKVAQTLGEPPEKLLRLAGILPPIPDENDSVLQELAEIIRYLSPSQRREALRYDCAAPT